MKITRKKLRKLIKESMLSFPHAFTDDLIGAFNANVLQNNRVLKLTTIFPDNCQVVIIIIYEDVYHDGETSIYLAELDTLGSGGNVDFDCYQKGYARKAMSTFLKIVDKYDIEVSLTAMSQNKKMMTSETLRGFYSSLGFVSRPNQRSEMTRFRLSERKNYNLEERYT